jgi:hypothetical protein
VATAQGSSVIACIKQTRSAAIDGGDVRHMIAKERAPALTGRRIVTLLGHVLGHRRLRHREPKLEQLAMNVRRTPQRVLEAHAPDQGPQLA